MKVKINTIVIKRDFNLLQKQDNKKIIKWSRRLSYVINKLIY